MISGMANTNKIRSLLATATGTGRGRGDREYLYNPIPQKKTPKSGLHAVGEVAFFEQFRPLAKNVIFAENMYNIR